MPYYASYISCYNGKKIVCESVYINQSYCKNKNGYLLFGSCVVLKMCQLVSK